MQLRRSKGKSTKKPTSPKKVGRPKKYTRRSCPHCLRKMKTAQGLRKHLNKKLKCDPASVAARAAERKKSRRLSAKTYYYRKKLSIPLDDWRSMFPHARLLAQYNNRL
ncbi:hypothetical protein F441_15350 [Phytophthora nicotianae CJ01A1]|uniref:C2H2-type domain-containing protein n=1 Tax=Phytophthora nicotianae CJ01A1 TaxID=1317063 RepID=W2WGP4_PHYNI|nr:hypothetical protein F441_15350 [Phytophthora nicotianae CJ01A1]